MADKTKNFSKTAFILLIFLIGLVFVMTPIVGIIAGKVLGAMSIGWPIGALLMAGLMSMLDSCGHKLNDDFIWKYSNNLDKKIELEDKSIINKKESFKL